MEYDKKYSCKDFSGHRFTDATDMDGIVIVNSSFAKEVPDTEVFPATKNPITFVNCNLDNCFLPDGTITEGCSTRRFEAQEDGEDWHVDYDSLPIEPVEMDKFIASGRDLATVQYAMRASASERLRIELYKVTKVGG